MPTIKATGSKYAQAILDFKGSRVRFEPDYDPQRLIYDMYPEVLVVKAARQVGKSLGLGGRINIGSISQPWFTSLYISPSQTQTKRFSVGYLDIFRDSKFIKKFFVNSKDVGNVFHKSYNNKSEVILSYAQTGADADRVRGITADLLCIDEVQDVSIDIIPVIAEVLNTSDYGYQIFTGTSKSTANTLEQLWLTTNQMEFVKKCDKCSKWVIPNEYDLCMEMCVNPKTLVCPYCHSPFSFNGGQWVSTKPGVKRQGLHLPQLIFGANCKPGKWERLYAKVDLSRKGVMYTPTLIANEIFGLATDLGASSLSLGEAQGCCVPDWTEWPSPDGSNLSGEMLSRAKSITNVVLGVDWSVSGSQSSMTVVSVIGIDSTGGMILLEATKLSEGKILDQVDRVCEIARKWNVSIVASDRGVGVLQAELMANKLGRDKVIMCQYVTSNTRLYWNSNGNFLAADRTQAMDNVMMKMRLGVHRFATPNWNLTEGLWNDALAIYEEETRTGRRLYIKDPNIPDDWFHSVVFANLGYQYLTGDYTFVE
jgi:hypothetical protein